MTYSLEEAKFQVRSMGQNLKKEGLMVGSWGNVSVRVDENTFVISPSGTSFNSLSNEDIVRVNIKDGSHDAGKVPSSEYLIHLITYKSRPDVSCVIHTHQPVATALSTLGVTFNDIKRYIPEGMTRDVTILGNTIPVTSYQFPGTKDMMKAIGKAWKKNPEACALLIKNHGAIICGEEARETFYIVKMLEKMSKWIYSSIVEIDEEDLKFEDAFETKYRDKLKWAKDNKEMLDKYSFVSRSPFLVRYSNLGMDLEAYIDDMAQLCGDVVVNLTGKINQSFLAKQLKDNSACLLKGKGAVCVAESEIEARNLCMVLEKNAMAAYLAKKYGNIPPIPEKYAKEDRKFYLKSYSQRVKDSKK